MVSEHLLYELEAVLMRPWFRRKLSYDEVLEYVMWLHDGGTVVDQLPLDTVPRYTADPDDDYLVFLAASSAVDYLVSGDHHLLDMGDVIPATTAAPLIPVLTPRRFLEKLDQEG